MITRPYVEPASKLAELFQAMKGTWVPAIMDRLAVSLKLTITCDDIPYVDIGYRV